VITGGVIVILGLATTVMAAGRARGTSIARR
jgi:hypothetical protein